MAIQLAILVTLIIIGTLTREMTGVIIWLSIVAIYPRKIPILVTGSAMALIFIGLRLLIDAPPSEYTISHVFALNLEAWRIQNLLVYGSLFGLACAWLLQSVPRDSLHRRVLIVILIPYITLSLVFGIWQEIRLWMPVYLLLIPLMKVNTNA